MSQAESNVNSLRTMQVPENGRTGAEVGGVYPKR